MLRIVLSGPRASEQLVRTALTGKGVVLDPHCAGWVAPEGFTGEGPHPAHNWGLQETRVDDESYITCDAGDPTTDRVAGIVTPLNWEVRAHWHASPPAPRQPTIAELIEDAVARKLDELGIGA